MYYIVFTNHRATSKRIGALRAANRHVAWTSRTAGEREKDARRIRVIAFVVVEGVRRRIVAINRV